MFTYLSKWKFALTVYVNNDSIFKRTIYILNNYSLLYEKENEKTLSENNHHRFAHQKGVHKSSPDSSND
jgi:hypothetical protein